MKNKKRILWLLIVIFVCWIAVIVRLGFIQIKEGPTYKAMALAQNTLDASIMPIRGEIKDRNGDPLAVNVNTGDVYAELNIINDKKMGKDYPVIFAEKLSSLLGVKKEDILKQITQKNVIEVLIRKKVPEDTIKKIKEAKLEGIRIVNSMGRSYPYDNFLSQVLGFTGTDNQGLDGIEAMFDKYLYGVPGRIITQVDAAGRILDNGTQKYYEATKGDDVILSIDEVIQHFTEEAVQKAYAENNPKNVIAIVIDPKTGEILALASKPDYNPNRPFDVSPKLWSSPAVTLNYEPGSVFKTITASAALDTATVGLNDSFYCNGYLDVAGRKINCWATHGQETFVQGVENSCNVVFMKVGQKLGRATLYKYIYAFGFGQPTGIQLPGEEAGIVMPESKVGPVELATISFGQGISVTPIQMIYGFSAVINGGNLMKPIIVKKIVSSDGKVVKEYKPQIVRQVISKQTSDTMRKILESVVSQGTGKNAFIPGYRVGGKTGTTQGYTKDHYVASFAGFAPVDDPKIAVLVIINQPQGGGHMGGEIAAPVAKDIIYNSLRYLGVEPVYKDNDVANVELTTPDLINLTYKDAILRISELNLKYQVVGKGDTVVEQVPRPGTKINQGETVTLILK